MFHLCGFHENINTAVLDYVLGIADPRLRIVGDDVIVPREIPNLLGCMAIGATITQAQLLSPSLRRLALQDVDPLNVGAEPLDTQFPTVFHDWFDRPIPLDPTEALNARINQGAGAAERETVLVWLGTGVEELPEGKMFTVRCTNATTLTAYTWTNGALTLSQTLPAGAYAVVGGRAYSAGLIAFRLVFVGADWCPGAVGVDATGDQDVKRFRYGGAGVWGTFEHDHPPTVDFFSASGDSAQVVDLDLIQTRALAPA